MKIKLALHIHFKNGKLAIWATVIDGYITDWTDDEDYIIAEYATRDVYSKIKTAKEEIQRAHLQGCSALSPTKHSQKEL